MLNFKGYQIPEHIKRQLAEYLDRGVPQGGFLYAVLTNNLHDAVGTANQEEIGCLRDIVSWVYMYAPEAATGSDARYLRWINERPKQTVGPKDLA
jgi:hypothetical protein